ncbi:MAG: Type 1 glutamine amidotransferase-like domain-containing protein [Pirellulales bacterium]
MGAPTIIASGGGGFSSEPDNSLLDDYILSSVAKPLPRVCFVPTASGDADPYIVKFYSAFSGSGIANRQTIPTHLSLFRRTVGDLRSFILQQDIIYVGGGNTANMLAAWRVHGLDVILREAWARGIILCGPSAGGVCWFESGVTDSFGLPLREVTGCLDLLPGSFCPHYDSEPTRRPTYERLVAEGTLPAGFAADDRAALKFTGTELSEVVSSGPEARAWRVTSASGRGSSEELKPRYLGTAE